MVASITPEAKIQEIIPRIKGTAADIAEVSKIKIMYPNENSLSHELISFENPQDFENKMKANLNLLWRCSLLFEKPHPSWSRYMQGNQL